MKLNKYSRAVTQDPTQPAAQAMLHAIGLTDEDFQKPLIGIASTGYEGNPCNMHLNELAADIKLGINKQSLVGLIFNTIGVSDGISMGHQECVFHFHREILLLIQLKQLSRQCHTME